MSLILGGVEYLTCQEVRQRWPDVDAERLRDWTRAGKVTPLTVGQLATLTGRPVPEGLHPDQPARDPSGRGGARNLYPWPQLVEAESSTSRQARGVRRGHAAGGQPA